MYFGLQADMDLGTGTPSLDCISGNGAVREDFFDLNLSDEDCKAFLHRCLHSAPQPIDCEEHGVIKQKKTCHERHGMCQNACFCHGPESATSFVKQFNRALVDNSVKVGSLILASVEQTGESSLFFLGVCTQRPQTHILLHMELSHDGFCSFSTDAHGRPLFTTSLQLFQRMLSHAPQPFRKVPMEVWKYIVVHDASSTPVVRIEVVESQLKFLVDLDAKYQPRKPRPKLRFGFKLPGSKSKTMCKASANPKIKALQKGLRRKLNVSSRPGREEHLKKSEKSSLESSSESSSSGVDSEAEIEGHESDSAEREDQEVLPVSEHAKQEEISALQEAKNYESSKAEAVEAATKKKPSSFFARETGVQDIGLATSSRSTCYFCKDNIPKFSVRYSFFHSRTKPSNWVHAKCLPHLCRREQCLEQTKTRLLELLGSVETQSSGSGQEPELSKAIQTTLNELTC